MTRSLVVFFVVIPFLLSILLIPVHAVATYQVSDLDPGRTLLTQRATDINNSGQICGYLSDLLTQGYPRAFVRDTDGTVRPLAKAADYSNSQGLAINERGQVVGSATYLYPGLGFDQVYPCPVSWDSSDGVRKLGTARVASFAYAVNSSGRIVGTLRETMVLTPTACVWDDNGLVMNLHGPSGEYAWARGINDSGTVAGYYMGGVPCKWDSEGNVTILGLLDGTQSAITYAINNSGVVAGYCGTQACLWAGDGTVRALATPDTCIGSTAYAVNSLGQAVGNWRRSGDQGIGSPCMWDTDGTFIDLGLIAQCYEGEALGINDLGQVVGWCGTETTCSTQGTSYAVLWNPVPEPGSIITLAPGMFCVLSALLRKRR